MVMIILIRLVFLAFFFRIFACMLFPGNRDPRQTLQLFSFLAYSSLFCRFHVHIIP